MSFKWSTRKQIALNTKYFVRKVEKTGNGVMSLTLQQLKVKRCKRKSGLAVEKKVNKSLNCLVLLVLR